MENRRSEGPGGDDNNQMVDYMLNNNAQQQQQMASGFGPSSNSLSFADVMQFADFGPKLALNQSKSSAAEEDEREEDGIDPVYFLKFPVLNDKLQDENHPLMMFPQEGLVGDEDERFKRGNGMTSEESGKARKMMDQEGRIGENASSVQLQFLGEDVEKNSQMGEAGKNKKKRPRTTKTSEEVESQRMTHIAVERNRRKQMNEHLRVLRSLMPGSYVQRGDQASIIGGAIEFVRELEQLLQCLESQKRRRLYGDAPPPPRPIGDSANPMQQTQVPPPPPPFFNPMSASASDDPLKLVSDYENGLIREETAESKSCLADVEVRVLGFDAMIKILCRRSPGQLIKTIAALEDLELNILHTNITTIEQTVLYSFNVKVASESSFTAEDIANAVQQIFSFIHADSANL
ncbi:transcription factor FAMA isoform X2 [Daucus carota subsp. sativus]|uniref:BHLH domain-containing protein n=3 Tax=Daucus carota subsp. sativus TaxID=79200 RepID=A0A175YRZ3_DAUCS|nr:PREDICTED: transcription factor FAMA [Daucus carota subsp. sativus]